MKPRQFVSNKKRWGFLLAAMLAFGFSAYTLPAQAATEICNGVDDDADGRMDEYFGDLNHDSQANCVDPDDDGDGIADAVDQDDDNDGTVDALDVDDDGDGVAEQEVCNGQDDDHDGLTDEGFADLDRDGQKNCVDADDDNDLIADSVDKDDDNDGILDATDVDDDNDGRAEVEMCNGVDDNHNGRVDEGFPDSNRDGQANCVDDDIDGDGDLNGEDGDDDGDGVGDTEDADDDGNGKAEMELCNGVDDDSDGTEDENCADLDQDAANNGVDTDDDNDGVADILDPDDDNDGVDDSVDSDDDGDGKADTVDLDADNDGIDDVADTDDDNDGSADSVEMVAGTSLTSMGSEPLYVGRVAVEDVALVMNDNHLVSIQGLTYSNAEGRVVALATDTSGSQVLVFVNMSNGLVEKGYVAGPGNYSAITTDGKLFYLLDRSTVPATIAVADVSLVTFAPGVVIGTLATSGLVDPVGLGYDGRLLVTDNNGGTPLLRFLDPASGNELGTYALEAPSVDVEFVDGDLLSVRPDGGVYLLGTSPCNGYPTLDPDLVGICALIPDAWLFSVPNTGGIATDGANVFSTSDVIPTAGAFAAAASASAGAGVGIAMASPINPAAADLVVSAVTPNAASVDAGKTLMVANTVRNQGQSASSAFMVVFRLSPNAIYGDADDVLLPAKRTVAMLAAGAPSVATTGLMIPKTVAAGQYHVCAMADPGNAVSELDEGNNSLCSDALITVVSLPDLVVSSVSARIIGTSVSVTASVRNMGTAAAGAFAVDYALSADKLYDAADAPLCSRSLAGLVAGLTAPAAVACPLPAAVTVGLYYLVARVDAANAVAEKIETNNDKSSMSPLKVMPDLSPTSVSFVLVGNTLTVTDTVANRGILEAGPFEEGIMVQMLTTDGSVAPAVRLCSRGIARLGSAATSTGLTACDISALSPGSYQLSVVADVDGRVLESNESNNRVMARGIITIKPGSTTPR